MEQTFHIQRKGVTTELAVINANTKLSYHIFSAWRMLLACPKFIRFWRWEKIKETTTYSELKKNQKTLTHKNLKSKIAMCVMLFTYQHYLVACCENNFTVQQMNAFLYKVLKLNTGRHFRLKILTKNDMSVFSAEISIHKCYTKYLG